MRFAFLTIVAVIVLAVVGGIVWVHYYYLPQMAAAPAPGTSSIPALSSADAIPSPKTAAAMQTIQYLIQQHHSPILNATPTPLTLAPVSTTKSTTLSYLGLTLSVPWVGITKTTQKGNPPELVEVDFANGRSITIMRGLTSSTSTLANGIL